MARSCGGSHENTPPSLAFFLTQLMLIRAPAFPVGSGNIYAICWPEPLRTLSSYELKVRMYFRARRTKMNQILK